MMGAIVDLFTVALLLPQVDRWRSLGPEVAVENAREAGRARGHRSTRSRARLRRAINLVDRLSGANCYRRVLLEVACDRKATLDPVFFGVQNRISGERGHTWLGRDADQERRFEAVFHIA